MVRYLSWPLLVGAVLLSSACVATTEQYQALQQDVRTLRGEVNALAQGRGVGGESQVGGEGGVSRATDLVARLEELATETRMIQGQLEENNYRLSELSQRLDDTQMKVARLLGEPEKPGGTSPTGQPSIPSGVPLPPRSGTSSPSGSGQPLPPRGGVPAAPQPPTGSGPDQPVVQGSLPSPEEVYRTGLSDYTKGNYDLAIKSFRTYLTFFPKTSLVPNAQYWLGESYYSQRKYRDAIREFDKLIKEFPDNSRVPSAMLKKGYAYLELKETTVGQGLLRELIAKFPRSREARLAQESLERTQ